MQGYVVQVVSANSPSASQYYVLCGDETEAIRLARAKLELGEERSVSILRPVAQWEIDTFGLFADEVRKAP